MDNNKVERNQSIELLRFVLMTLIVFGHILGHGFGMYNADGTASVAAYLQPFYSYHVDAFIFISGYYGIRLKWNKLVMLLLKMVIYSIVAIAVVGIFFQPSILTLDGILHNLFPVSTCDWWFMSQYLFLMLISPLLNAGMDVMDRKQSAILVLVLYLSSFRLYSSLMIFIYLLARHLRTYPCTCLEHHAGKVFIGTILAFFLFKSLCIQFNVFPEKLLDYMSPFNILAAASVFFVFQKQNFTWQGFGLIGSGVIAAYLITDHELLRPYFTKGIAEESNSFVLYFIIACIVVLVCAIFDRLVSFVINTIVTKVGLRQ